MSPIPSKLFKIGAHTSACQITCISCWRRVVCEKSGGVSVPDPAGSQLLNQYYSDLALVRYGLIWDYSQAYSDAIHPMRICTSCRLDLILD